MECWLRNDVVEPWADLCYFKNVIIAMTEDHLNDFIGKLGKRNFCCIIRINLNFLNYHLISIFHLYFVLDMAPNRLSFACFCFLQNLYTSWIITWQFSFKYILRWISLWNFILPKKINARGMRILHSKGELAEHYCDLYGTVLIYWSRKINNRRFAIGSDRTRVVCQTLLRATDGNTWSPMLSEALCGI